jgi:hypothetical protein
MFGLFSSYLRLPLKLFSRLFLRLSSELFLMLALIEQFIWPSLGIADIVLSVGNGRIQLIKTCHHGVLSISDTPENVEIEI